MGRIITGLDMGSNRVTCAIGEVDDEDKITILASATRKCGGLGPGVVIDITKTSEAISHVINKARSLIDKNKKIDFEPSVNLGLHGEHISMITNSGRYNIPRDDKQINQEDVQNVIEAAKAIQIPQEEEIIHTIPQYFKLDRESGIQNPIDLEASLLEAKVNIIKGSVSRINNLKKTVSYAGFSADSITYCPLALGETVLYLEEKERGCILVDIGGSVSSVAVYKDGYLCFAKEIRIGGQDITKDIATVFGVTNAEAESIKKNTGVVNPSLMENDKDIEISNIYSEEKRKIKLSELADCINARLEEILEKVADVLKQSPVESSLLGMVFCGDDSFLKGFLKFASERMGIQNVRNGHPIPKQIIIPENFKLPICYNAISLIVYTLFKQPLADLSDYPTHEYSPNGGLIKSIIKAIKGSF